MLLPAIDVGLMDEHLTTHEGLIHKLRLYKSRVKHPTLQKLIELQLSVLKSHVIVMRQLLNPSTHQWLSLEPIHEDFNVVSSKWDESTDKPIALELRSTATFMSNMNFTSALLMKNLNVKHVHYEMALQQATIQRLFNNFINQMSPEHPAMATKDTQLYTIKKNSHIV